MATKSLKQSKQNLETYSLIWLDAAVNTKEENILAQQQLRTSINYLNTFEDDNECEEYIRAIPKEDRIVLIVSGRFGEKIVPRIHPLQQVFSIYVYCENKAKHKQWAVEFCKVKAVVVVLNKLINKILSDQTQRQHAKIDEAFSISIFSTSATGEGQSTSGINGHFIHSQLLIDCLIAMKSKATDKMEFISVCKNQYEDNNEALKILEEFERDYSPCDALRWYTRQSFLYRLLNKGLRVQNIDLLFLFRFFIRDIGRQLENNKCSSPIRVYRGQLMAKDEVNVLKSSVGDFISINSFLSTSLNRELALFFITDSNASDDLERVFFEIQADPQLENIKPFSNITTHSYFPEEEEILFMIGSIFQLSHIDYTQNGIWLVRMNLSTGNDHQLNLLIKHLRNEYDDGENTLMSFCDVLFKMGKLNDAEKYYLLLLKEPSLDDKCIARCYHSLGKVARYKDDLDGSLIWFNKSLEIKLKRSKSNDPEIAEIFISMGNTYRKKDELEQAIDMFKRALTIWNKTFEKYALQVARCYSDLGSAYLRKEECVKALEYHQKALNIHEKYLPKYHSDSGVSHTNIATVHRQLKNFDLALEHSNLALEILQKSLPPQHSRIAWVFESIGLVYEQQGKLNESLSYLEKANTIYRQTLPISHYYITDVEENIHRVSSQLQ